MTGLGAEAVDEGAQRDGSIVKLKARRGDYGKKGRKAVRDGHNFPSNEEIVKELQARIASSVDMNRKYRHVAWYTIFVAAYLLVLYLQASAYKSGEVVQTLRNALMPDGKNTMTFHSGDEVLAYLGTRVLLPTWKDPECGDGNCEWPWEFPAYGRFGCQADCGKELNLTKIAVNVRADFVGHPTISARMLMSSAKWNLCLADEDRKSRGEEDLCWFEDDQVFKDLQENRLEAMDVVDGVWYIIVKGDYAGRVSGTVYDITNSSDPIRIETKPAWEKCKLPRSSSSSSGSSGSSSQASGAVRRLLMQWNEAHGRGEDGTPYLQEIKEVLINETTKFLKPEARQIMRRRLQMLELDDP